VLYVGGAASFAVTASGTMPNPPLQIEDEYLESIQNTGTNQFYRLQLNQ
jgi:hypothetical protein